MVLCKDCEYNKETNLFHTGRYCMRLGAICGLLGCEKGVPKVKTNADRIRAMSDEELCDEYFRILNHQLGNYTDSRLGLLEWLKKEAKNETQIQSVL